MAGKKGSSGGKRAGAGRKPARTSVATAEEIEKFKEYLVQCDMRDLKFPDSLKDIPYARQAWDYVIELNEHSNYHLLNERHFEAIKSYCLAVSMRQQIVDKWRSLGCPTMCSTERCEPKTHPLITELEKKSVLVNKFADDLALSVLGELKAAKVRALRPEDNGEEDLFD